MKFRCFMCLIAFLSMPCTAAERQDFSGIAEGAQTLAMRQNLVPLLSNFYFHFKDGLVSVDRNLSRVAINPDQSTGKLHLWFGDNGFDDRFDYRISLLYLPASQVVTGEISGTCAGGPCERQVAKPEGNWIFVVSGFDFMFVGEDHQLDQLAILERNNGKVYFAFHDKNWDDRYSFRIKYAWVPQQLFIRLAEKSGLETNSNHLLDLGHPLDLAIRSFKMDFAQPGDHPLAAIGIAQTNDLRKMTVHYRDDNGDDDFNYIVRYGGLY